MIEMVCDQGTRIAKTAGTGRARRIKTDAEMHLELT
jgi:hypothetical protein